jgi:transcription antitermination factor NusG
MPILPKERDVFPEDLLAGPAAQGGDGAWYVFYTLARREKDLLRKLTAAGIGCYAPMIRRRLRGAGGRPRTSFVPLFPGYVFSHGDDEQRRAALATNTIARWIPVADPRMLVDDLRAIKRLVDSEQPLSPEARLEAGQAVRVRSGPLAGIEGTIIRRRGTERLLVAVRFLNQGASIEMEDVDLELL